MNNKLFSSTTDPIPPVRRDIQIIPIEQNGDSYLYFRDQREYIESGFALDRQVETVLSLLDGQKSIEDLNPYLGDGVTQDQMLQFVRFLDENRLLASEHFRHHAEQIELQYEQSTLHQSTTAGFSYPKDPHELKKQLEAAFANSNGHAKASSKTKALYAPHIDPRVAMKSYVNAFAPIRDRKPKRVVLIATSHYAGLYPELYQDAPFILVNKDFELPLNTIPQDTTSIEKLAASKMDAGITTRDRAHRMEHSIELHLLFLSYLWDHDFKIIPFLTRSLDDLYYMQEGQLGTQLNNFASLLREQFGNDDETFFLISGDLAHFGQKFGDEQPASTYFEEVKDFDRQFLDCASKNQQNELLELMKSDFDPYRICGFPPLYTFLKAMPQLRGHILDYQMWDERERESAVTFGSILFDQQRT